MWHVVLLIYEMFPLSNKGLKFISYNKPLLSQVNKAFRSSSFPYCGCLAPYTRPLWKVFTLFIALINMLIAGLISSVSHALLPGSGVLFLFILLSHSEQQWKKACGVIYAHMCLLAPLMTGPGGGAHDEWLSIGDLLTATMMWVKMEIALFHRHYISLKLVWASRT